MSEIFTEEPEKAEAELPSEPSPAPEAEPAPEPEEPEPSPAPEAELPSEPEEPEPSLPSEPEEKVVQEDELIYEQLEDEEIDESQSPYDRPGKWYVVSTASGHEKLAKSNLENRIQSMGVAEKVFEVTIPMEEQVEFKGAKKEVVKKKVFPGYLLVRCFLDDDTWHVIRNTPSITGFIGPGSKPAPLRRNEVETFLGHKSDGMAATKKIRPRLRYDVGETVRVKEGPFTDFQGEVTEINEDQLKVKLLLNIFGRDTPVELEFSQVSKQ